MDLENVHGGGLIGAEKLNPEEDKIIIFESEKCILLEKDIPNIDIPIYMDTAHNGYPNSMDIKIVGRVFKEYEPDVLIYIISRDRGYLKVLEAASLLGVNSVKVLANIEQVILHSKILELNANKSKIDEEIEIVNKKMLELIYPIIPNKDEDQLVLEEILKKIGVKFTPQKIKALRGKLTKAKSIEDLISYFDAVISTKGHSMNDNIRDKFKKLKKNAELIWRCRKIS